MTRINTNVSALIAQSNLARSNADLATRLQRLSTGVRINRGADDPAGLIVSERLRTEIQGIGQSIDNIERASNVIATTEGALQEINTLLTSVKGLTIEAANTGAFSKEEIQANQLQIDSAIESITRISNTASFAGLKLLNGSLDYLTEGVDDTEITDVNIYSVNFGTSTSMPVQVETLDEAEKASLFISGGTGTANFLSSVSFEVQGVHGVEAFEFVSGTTFTQVIDSVNQLTDATGVTARLANAGNPASGVVLESVYYGSDQFVAVRKLSDGNFFESYDYDFDTSAAITASTANRDTGEDVLALVNGNLAIGDGLGISLNAATLKINMQLTETAATSIGAKNPFTIVGGGATYQIGPNVNSQQQVGFGIQSVAATRLGNYDVGFLHSVSSGGENSLITGKAREAGAIIDAAIEQVTRLRGRLGAFERNTLETTLRSQQIGLENITAAESSIRDADFAEETSALSRAQILQQAGTSTLSIANSTAQTVLNLLG